jgi:S1-C subfamily serine protease
MVSVGGLRNSGGPIINKNGSVVGVSVNISSGDGDYDDLGYGTVIPIKYVIEEIVNTSEKFILDASNTKFVDFE